MVNGLLSYTSHPSCFCSDLSHRSSRFLSSNQGHRCRRVPALSCYNGHLGRNKGITFVTAYDLIECKCRLFATVGVPLEHNTMGISIRSNLMPKTLLCLLRVYYATSHDNHVTYHKHDLSQWFSNLYPDSSKLVRHTFEQIVPIPNPNPNLNLNKVWERG